MSFLKEKVWVVFQPKSGKRGEGEIDPLGTLSSDGPGEDFHATLAFIVSLGAVASLTTQLFPPFFLSFESPLYAKYIIEEQAEYILQQGRCRR
jgi:hypothetical protein